jgi:hypothetical protein
VTVPQLPSLAQYLQQSGWALEDDDRLTTMWRQQNPAPGKKLQIVLPATQSVEDWPERVSDALDTLAFVERRSPEEIAEDISYGGADNVAVRLTPDTPPGQAPLSLASSAVSALHSYVVASASALEIPDAVLPSHRPPWAESYADKVRLAAQSGSFVLSLTLPLIVELEASGANDRDTVHDTLFEITSQPLGRRVTNRMLNAAQAAQKLASEVLAGRSAISSFGDSALNRAATNATELSALKALGGPESFPYQIRFAQSPLAGSQRAPINLRMTSAQEKILGDAADFLRTRQPTAGVSVHGYVVRLHRTRALGPGDIVVEGFDNETNATRRWRVELGEDEYNQAARAHLTGLQISVTGDREERGTHLQLRNLSSFNVIPGMDYGQDDARTESIH